MGNKLIDPSDKESAERYFINRSEADLIKLRDNYRRLLALTGRKAMPWMKPHWQKGLETVERILAEKQPALAAKPKQASLF